MSESLDYLFVYGTLRSDSYSDSHRQYIEPNFTLVSRATMPGRLFVIADYPGLLLPEAVSDLVVGEVYSFTGGEAQLTTIDKYEGCALHSPEPHLFRRSQETVSFRDDSTVSAWVYFYNFLVSDTMLIRSGDFLDPF